MSNLSDLLPAGAGGKNVSLTANGTIYTRRCSWLK